VIQITSTEGVGRLKDSTSLKVDKGEGAARSRLVVRWIWLGWVGQVQSGGPLGLTCKVLIETIEQEEWGAGTSSGKFGFKEIETRRQGTVWLNRQNKGHLLRGGVVKQK